MNGSNARADTYLYLLDYPLSKGCEYLAWNVLGDATSGAGAQKALKRPAAPTPQLWLVEECWWDAQGWNVNRKPSAGILRAWVRSEPPALTWLLLGFNFDNFRIYEEICT